MKTKEFIDVAIQFVIEHAKRCETDEVKKSKITEDAANVIWTSSMGGNNAALILLDCYGGEIAYLVAYNKSVDRVEITYYTIKETIEIEDFNKEW